MFIFLLSGLLCCLCFSDGFFWLFGRGVFYFLLFGRGRGPRPNSEKKGTPQTAKKINTTPPLPSVCFCCLGERAYFYCCLGGGGGGSCVYVCVCVCFLCLGGGRVFFCWLFGRGRVFFAVWAGACFFCCLGGGREFTHLPVCLAHLQATQQQKRPNSKKKTRVPFAHPPSQNGPTVASTFSWLNKLGCRKHEAGFCNPNQKSDNLWNIILYDSYGVLRLGVEVTSPLASHEQLKQYHNDETPLFEVDPDYGNLTN